MLWERTSMIAFMGRDPMMGKDIWSSKLGGNVWKGLERGELDCDGGGQAEMVKVLECFFELGPSMRSYIVRAQKGGKGIWEGRL